MKHLPLIALLALIPVPLHIQQATANETQLVREIEPELKEYAKNISVKVTSDRNNYGSGVIIGKQGSDEYLVITNNHVVRGGNSFSIQTADGTEHQASIVENPIASDDDIALLTFNSNKEYQLAEVNSVDAGNEEKRVVATGYSADTGEFAIESGKIEKITSPSFKEGYRLGYTNNVASGMSGGAILDELGDLVGINGIGAYPILNTAYQYEDETTPSIAEIEQFRALSWGLSVHRLLTQLNSEIITAYGLPLPKTAADAGKTELTGWLGELEALAQQITVKIDSSSGANGSGVIIAKEGNTYTVLTADHVLCEKDGDTNDCIGYDYEIVTADGERYPIDASTVKAEAGVDLATIRFTSNQTYQVAELADYPVQTGDAVFVAGYPKLGKNTVAQWQFSLGYGLDKETGLIAANVSSNSNSTKDEGSLASSSLAGGYEMVYTSLTHGGMSGGAVLDKDGRVIGIHGQAEGETTIDSKTGASDKIQLGYSLGIPINTFIGLKTRLGVGQSLTVAENKPAQLTSNEAEVFSAAILGTEISDSNATAKRWLERGNQLWRLQRHQEAEAAFDKAIELNDAEFNYLAHYGEGLALAYQTKDKLALSSLERAIASNSEFAPVYGLKSQVLARLSRFDQALIAIDRALALEPKNVNYYFTKAWVSFYSKQLEEAIVAQTRAIEISPRSIFYYNRGVFYREQGQVELALGDYSKALEINPNYADAYGNRGVLYQQQGQVELALADYNQVLEINPNNADAYNNRGALYQQQGKVELALADYNQVLEINPNNASAYNNRGALYQQQGKVELAQADYNQVLEINPNNASAYNNRGNLYDEQGQVELAQADYNQALGINPNNADAYYNRGLLYQQMGDNKAAIANTKKAWQLFIEQNNLAGAEQAANFLKSLE